ncbi:FtsX-like permease family protein [Myxococcus stipitatus]|uniref:ABC transporter permease n=1 Tax=Myxococcus stipitatus TaxID=83455 RepID=UPI0031454ED4
MFVLFQMALGNLRAHRERALLLFLVVAGASGVLVMSMALTAGVASAHREATTTYLSGEVNVGGYFKVHPDSVAPVMGSSAKVREVLTPLVPEGCHLRERGRGRATVGVARRRYSSFLVSLDVAGEKQALDAIVMKEGDLNALARPRTLVLSTAMAERLKVGVGDMATLFTESIGTLRRNAVDVEVVAIMQGAGLLGSSSGILVSNATLGELQGYRAGAAGVLQLECLASAAGGRDPNALGDSWRQALRSAGFEVLPAMNKAYGDKLAPMLREGWRGQRLDVSTWEDESWFLRFITDGLSALTVLLGLIMLAVVVVGLFMAQSVAVRERTREIGTLRAMGLQRPLVAVLFMTEGLLLGALGSVCGAAAALGACVLLRDSIPLPGPLADFFFSPHLPLSPDVGSAVVAVVLVTFCASLAVLVPSLRAAWLSPRSAMESL